MKIKFLAEPSAYASVETWLSHQVLQGSHGLYIPLLETGLGTARDIVHTRNTIRVRASECRYIFCSDSDRDIVLFKMRFEGDTGLRIISIG